jgi:hypothetical protein
MPQLIIIVDGITRTTIEAITTDIITVAIIIATITAGVTIYTGPGFPGLLAIIAIGKTDMEMRAKSRDHPRFKVAFVVVRFDHIA